MKKHVIVSLFLALALVVGHLSFPLTSAVADYDRCDAGDHAYEFISSEPAGYGGTRYFTVSRCAYASYSHKHYYITGQMQYRYQCKYCGHIDIVTKTYDDTEMGPICTLHDTGR